MSEFANTSAVDEEVVDEVSAMLDLTKMKKKKKKKTTEGESDAAAPASSSSAGGNLVVCVNTETPPTYSYSFLLNRIVSFLEKNNPELSEKRRNTLKPPQLMRVGKILLW